MTGLIIAGSLFAIIGAATSDAQSNGYFTEVGAPLITPCRDNPAMTWRIMP